MGNFIGKFFKLTTFGESHGIAIGGVIDGCPSGLKLDFQIIIITNQSGIARGLFSINDLHIFMQGLISELSDHKIHITDYFFCPHYPNGKITEYSKVCSCRKPEPGMLFQAKEKYSLDFSKSILIGDNETDIRAADNANLFSSILINNSGNPVNTSAANEAKNLIGASEIIKHYNT